MSPEVSHPVTHPSLYGKHCSRLSHFLPLKSTILWSQHCFYLWYEQPQSDYSLETSFACVKDVAGIANNSEFLLTVSRRLKSDSVSIQFSPFRWAIDIYFLIYGFWCLDISKSSVKIYPVLWISWLNLSFK